MNSELIHKLSDDLIRDEGIRLNPYKCSSGKLTIGIGRNIEDNGITDIEARMLLTNDINNCIDDLNMSLPFWSRLSNNRQRALLNMVFNLGITRLLTFKNMLKFMHKGEFDNASKEALDSKWARQVGNRAERIAELIKKG